MNESDTSLANKTGHFNLLTTEFLYRDSPHTGSAGSAALTNFDL